MSTQMVKVLVSEYKGRKLAWPFHASLKIANLMGDCSGFSVGCLNVGGGWRGNFKSNRGFYSYMGKLMAHVLVNQHLYKSFDDVGEPDYRLWDNKLVFTHSPEIFDNESMHYYYLMKALNDLSDREQQIVEVNSWVGAEFDIRVISVPKFLLYRKDLDIPFGDFMATATYQGKNWDVVEPEEYEEYRNREAW